MTYSAILSAFALVVALCLGHWTVLGPYGLACLPRDSDVPYLPACDNNAVRGAPNTLNAMISLLGSQIHSHQPLCQKSQPFMSDIKTKAEATVERQHDCYTTGEDVHDIDAGLYAEAEQLSAEELEKEGARVRKTLDWRIMPVVWSLP